MVTESREIFRDAFATLLSAELVGVGKPVQAVYNYFKGYLNGVSPAVMVTSGPISRQKAGMGTRQYRMRTGLVVIVMVAQIEGSTAGGNEQALDDLVDNIEALIADVVSANQNNEGVWNDLMYTEQPSQPLRGKDLSGKPHIVEFINLEAMLYD